MNVPEGRVALVSGASGALGGALVARLLAGGSRVAAIDRHPERTRAALGATAEAAGERFTLHGADFADRSAVERAVAGAIERHGAIHHVFNATGAFGLAESVEATTEALWTKLWDANFRPVLAVCSAVVPGLKRQGEGTIVNVGSLGALRGDAGVAAYSVAKAAVVRLTESLAAECRGHGVRVNCVLPGTIDTPANRAAMPDADPAGWVSLDALLDAMLFLASPAARAVHGVALRVDGPG